MKYPYKNAWYSINELSELSGIKSATVRDRLRRGYPVEEAIKLMPVQESVKEFSEASWWNDWVGMSTSELHEIYWMWCTQNGYTPLSHQGFTRHILSLYPQLKTVPTRRGDGAVRILRVRG